MKDLLHYSGICTKARAMKGRLFSEEDFQTIIALKDVVEVINFLKRTEAYGSYIRQMDTSLYHRGHVEKVLYQSLYDDYDRLLRFAVGTQKELLVLYGKRYEIDLLNYCLRIIINHCQMPFDIEYKKSFFSRWFHLDIESMILSGDIQEFLYHIKETEYYEPLYHVMQEGENTLFDYDMALTFFYYHSLVTNSKKYLNPEERSFFINMVMTEIDLQNLKCIYRIKKFFDMTPAQIYRMTIPYHYHLKLKDFKQLVEAVSLEDMMNRLEGTYYDRHILKERDASPDDLGRFYLADMYEREGRKNPYSGAVLISYLFMKEMEIDRLITVIECIRYDVPKSERIMYLGGGIH